MAVLNIRDLLIDRFGAPLTPRIDATATGSTVPGAQFLRGNPTRVAFVAINRGPFVVWAFPNGVTSIGRGFRVEPGGGALIALWEEDGELLTLPWFGVGDGGGSVLDTLELVIDAKAPRSPREEA